MIPASFSWNTESLLRIPYTIVLNGISQCMSTGICLSKSRAQNMRQQYCCVFYPHCIVWNETYSKPCSLMKQDGNARITPSTWADCTIQPIDREGTVGSHYLEPQSPLKIRMYTKPLTTRYRPKEQDHLPIWKIGDLRFRLLCNQEQPVSPEAPHIVCIMVCIVF